MSNVNADRVTAVLAAWRAAHERSAQESVDDEEIDSVNEYTYLDMLDAIKEAQGEDALAVLRKDWGREICDCNAESGGADDEWGVWFAQEAYATGAISASELEGMWARQYYGNDAYWDKFCANVEECVFS